MGADTPSRTKTELVVFDLDGTLVDSREVIVAALNRGLVAVGAEPRSEEELVRLVGRPLEQIFALLLPGQPGHVALQATEVYRRTYFDPDSYHSRVYPGVMECLEGLRDIKLAIATTKPTDTAIQVLEELGLTDRFDVVRGSEDLPKKPDPAVLHSILEALQANPKRSWMVGDTIYDIQAGKRADMHTCAVTHGFGSAEMLAGVDPDVLIDDLLLLPALLK